MVLCNTLIFQEGSKLRGAQLIQRRGIGNACLRRDDGEWAVFHRWPLTLLVVSRTSQTADDRHSGPQGCE
jgi:hypothetical protein